MVRTTNTRILVEPYCASGLVLPGNRQTEMVAFENAMVDFFLDAAGLLGAPKSVAAIYGIVFASPSPLSFAEIEARLDISKGSISQGIRVLREIGALKEVSSPAERVELFAPDMELRRLIKRFLEQRLQKQLDAGKARLSALKRALPNSDYPEAGILHSRFNQLQTWHKKARALIPVVKVFLKVTPG